MIKLSQIINSQQTLNKLLSISLPVKIAFTLSKLVNRMQPDLKIYEEQRIKLVKELGIQTDVETDAWKVKPENLDKFSEEIAKLQNIEVDLKFADDKDLQKIKIEDLGDLKIEPSELFSLDWLFE